MVDNRDDHRSPPVVRACGLSELADDDLMAACARGQEAAFGVLVRRHQQAALACALARCRGQMSEAQDIVQEAFLRLYRSAPRYQPKGRFLAYLYTIVRNEHNGTLRKLRRRCRELGGEVLETADPSDPFQALAIRIDIDRIFRDQNDQELLEILIAHRGLGMTQAEVARQFNRTLRQVRCALARATHLIDDALDRIDQPKEETLPGPTPLNRSAWAWLVPDKGVEL